MKLLALAVAIILPSCVTGRIVTPYGSVESDGKTVVVTGYAK